jgi:drug/metabolite transporter (DMT)-like permease
VVVAFGSAALGIKRPDYLIGDGLMLVGAMSAAIYSVFARRVLQRYDSLFVTGCGMVFGALALLPLAALAGVVSSVPRFTGNGWFALLFLGTKGESCSLGCLFGPCAGCRPSAR